MNENYLLDDTLFSYIDNMQPYLDGEIGRLQQYAIKENMPIITNDVVKLLGFLLGVTKPKHILEIGTAIGFSAIYMSSFLPEGGTLTTIDRYPFMIEEAKKNFKKFKADNITLLEGNANDIFQNGTVALQWEDIPHRQKTIYSRLNEFIYLITHNKKLRTSIISISDGLALMQKTEE